MDLRFVLACTLTFFVGLSRAREVCDHGFYGNKCLKICGHCAKGPCNATNGVCPRGCVPGWQGSLCDTRCSLGHYGLNCSKLCGNCQNISACSHDSGECVGGCQSGYDGVLCKDTKDSVTAGIAGGVAGAIVFALAMLAVILLVRQSTRVS